MCCGLVSEIAGYDIIADLSGLFVDHFMFPWKHLPKQTTCVCVLTKQLSY